MIIWSPGYYKGNTTSKTNPNVRFIIFDKLSYVPQVLSLMTTRYFNKFSLAAKHNHS